MKHLLESKEGRKERKEGGGEADPSSGPRASPKFSFDVGLEDTQAKERGKQGEHSSL